MLREFGAFMCFMFLVPGNYAIPIYILECTFQISIFTLNEDTVLYLYYHNYMEIENYVCMLYISFLCLFSLKTRKDCRGGILLVVEMLKNNRWTHNPCDAFQVSHCCHDYIYLYIYSERYCCFSNLNIFNYIADDLIIGQ